MGVGDVATIQANGMLKVKVCQLEGGGNRHLPAMGALVLGNERLHWQGLWLYQRRQVGEIDTTCKACLDAHTHTHTYASTQVSTLAELASRSLQVSHGNDLQVAPRLAGDQQEQEQAQEQQQPQRLLVSMQTDGE